MLHSTQLNIFFKDYPSIGQLSYKIAENKINVIFAVTGDQVVTYKALTEFLEGSTAGELDRKSSNIVDLVKDNYQVRCFGTECPGSTNIAIYFC